ncbi:MAG TPA: hypothetical protein VFJ62_11745 [Usitatibacter sp.]|nr:hypothetical protein [Usitatibacter sp.]
MRAPSISLQRARGLASVLLVLAIAAFFVAFLLYRAMGSMSKHADTTASNTTSFQAIDDALTRFVMLNRRLPCPASGTSTTGLAEPNASTVTCASPGGVVPWATLGLTQKDALDSWGRYIFYRVFDGASGLTGNAALDNCLDEQVTTVYAMSGPGGACNANTHENTLSDYFAANGLTVKDHGTDRKAAYVLISPGESGAGGYFPGGTAPLPAPVSANEVANAGSGGTYWIVNPSAPSVAPNDATHFDDVVTYRTGATIARAAHWGKPWPLSVVLNQTTLGLGANQWNTNATSLKAAVTGGPVMVNAASDSGTVQVCVINEDTQGASACNNNGGNDTIKLNERLGFDFRVSRRFLKVQLTDFRDNGGVIPEQVRFVFFNGTNLAFLIEKIACHTPSHSLGQFQINPPVDFTRVEVWGANATADFGVGSIVACKYDDAAHPCVLPNFDASSQGGWCP